MFVYRPVCVTSRYTLFILSYLTLHNTFHAPKEIITYQIKSTKVKCNQINYKENYMIIRVVQALKLRICVGNEKAILGPKYNLTLLRRLFLEPEQIGHIRLFPSNWTCQKC